MMEAEKEKKCESAGLFIPEPPVYPRLDKLLSESLSLTKILRMRREICLRLGVPKSILYGSQETDRGSQNR